MARCCPSCNLAGNRGESNKASRRPKRMSSMRWALTIFMPFFRNPPAEASQGPGSTRMNAQLGVVVEGPFDMTCTFLGRSKKVVIVYRRLSKEIWEPKLSCNDGAGSQIARHDPIDGRAPQLLLLGCYTTGQG